MRKMFVFLNSYQFPLQYVYTEQLVNKVNLSIIPTKFKKKNELKKMLVSGYCSAVQ